MWTKTLAWLGIASATMRVGSTTRPLQQRRGSPVGNHTGTWRANSFSISAVKSLTLSAPFGWSTQNGTSHPWTLAKIAYGFSCSVHSILAT